MLALSKHNWKGFRHVIVRVQGKPRGNGSRKRGLADRVHVTEVDLPLFWKEFGDAVRLFARSIQSRWSTFSGAEDKPSLTIDLVPFVQWYPVIWGSRVSDEMVEALESVLRVARGCANAACLDITLRLSDRSDYAGDGSFRRIITGVAGLLAVRIVYEPYQQVAANN